MLGRRSITKVDKEADGTLTLSVSVDGEESIKRTGYDTLIYAIGRSPAVSGLGLNEIGVNQNSSGHIRVDEYQETGVAGVYALGDVCGIQELTPVSSCQGTQANILLPCYHQPAIKFKWLYRLRLQPEEGYPIGCLEALSMPRQRSSTRRCLRSCSHTLLSARSD